jgi:hypothetical protein
MRVATFSLLALNALAILAFQAVHAADNPARLTSDNVAEMAHAYARTKIADLDRYTPNRPEYDSASRAWTVFYRQTKAPYAPDHDFWVHIDDTSGSPCLEFGIVPACA